MKRKLRSSKKHLDDVDASSSSSVTMIGSTFYSIRSKLIDLTLSRFAQDLVQI
jgi:hypothetical protein